MSQLYVSDRRGKPGRNPNRSQDLDYGANFRKLDDVTLYNSSTHAVNFYKSFPNRSGTPIKSPKNRFVQTFHKVQDPKLTRVRSLLPKEMLSNRTRRALYKELRIAPLRSSCTKLPVIKIHSPGEKHGRVMNDFHKRETNNGYARMEGGAYYNH